MAQRHTLLVPEVELQWKGVQVCAGAGCCPVLCVMTTPTMTSHSTQNTARVEQRQRTARCKMWSHGILSPSSLPQGNVPDPHQWEHSRPLRQPWRAATLRHTRTHEASGLLQEQRGAPTAILQCLDTCTRLAGKAGGKAGGKVWGKVWGMSVYVPPRPGPHQGRGSWTAPC